MKTKKFFTKQRAALALATIMMISIIVGAFAASSNPTFSDVPANHWAYASIEKMADEGVMNGVGGGRFNPSGVMTCSEFFAMVMRAFYPNTLAKAEQVYGTSEWWRPASQAAYECGILNHTTYGTAYHLTGIWSPGYEINRENMGLVVYNLLSNAGRTATKAQIEEAKAQVNDLEDIREDIQDYVMTAYVFGVIQGDNQGNFRPDDTMTRAEGAVVMDRLLSMGLTVEDGNVELPDPEPTPTPTPTPTPSAPEPSGDTVGAITPASSVNSVKPNVGKSDAYPTRGGAYYFANQDSYIRGGENGLIDYDGIIAKEQTLSNNGYRTGSNVEIGNAALVYEQLDMVNEIRAAAGKPALEWCPSDAAEEFSLLRAYELTISYSHNRPVANNPLTTVSEVIARGYGSAESVIEGWRTSPGHYAALTSDTATYMCAARCGNYWVITLWRSDSLLATAERYAATNYVE